MEVLKKLWGVIAALLAKSFLWTIIAFLASIPLGIILLNVFDEYVDNEKLMIELDHNIHLLFLVFCGTCFIGILLMRLVAISIKTIVTKKEAAK